MLRERLDAITPMTFEAELEEILEHEGDLFLKHIGQVRHLDFQWECSLFSKTKPFISGYGIGDTFVEAISNALSNVKDSREYKENLRRKRMQRRQGSEESKNLAGLSLDSFMKGD